MQQINVNDLIPHPRNNEFFDDITGEKWNEFLESIKTRGVIEPIVITPDRIIVSGHQRVRACKELGIENIMYDVHTYNNEEDILLEMLLLNIDRVKLLPKKTQKIEIIGKIEEICQKREEKERERRTNLIKKYRAQIKKYRINILSYHGNKCDVCNYSCAPILEVHHVLPLQEGGNNSLDNLMCLCPNCHSIIHKTISHINDEDEERIYKWIDDNYPVNAKKIITDNLSKYFRKKYKYGWEELTWI